MNFDDLHDPDPPRPGTDTLATVAGRARQIRRRRAALVATGGVLAAAIVVVPLTLALTGDETGERLVPATVPDVSLAETTTVPATTATVAPTTAPPALLPEVSAITADGDAVRIGADGSQTVLHDGADPRVQPAEGELTIVDSVVSAPNGRAFVSTCCEPVPGTWFDVEDADGFGGYGHGLELSPDGARIAMIGGDGVTVLDTSGQILAERTASCCTETPTQLEGVMWLGYDDQLVLLVLQEDRFSLARSPAANPFSLLGSATISVGVGVGPGSSWPQLAGVGPDGSILVLPGSGDPVTALEAYDWLTFERRPEADVALPQPATYAWFGDGVLTWIGADGALHVGDQVIPGEYRWARPVT